MLAQILLLLFFIVVVGVLIGLIIACKKYILPKCCNCFKKVVTKIENKLMYNSILRALMQTFLMTNISMWITFRDTDFTSSEGIVD